MAEMPDYNFSNSNDKQAFQRFMVELMRNEINSYTKQTQNSNPNPSASLEISVLPSGVIVPFAGGPGVTPNPGTLQDLPYGWLLCAGAAVSRNSYSALFAAVGTTYGVGDGSTTFNVPDLRGRVLAGKDDMGGTTASRVTSASGIVGTTLGAAGGDQRIQDHTHTFSGTTGNDSPDHTHLTNQLSNISVSAGGAVFHRNDSPYNQASGGASTRHQHSFSGTTANHNQTSGGASQNVQPTIILNYIIKA